jgi:hypothetical protein
MRTELNHSRYRVVWFCDVESRTEFRLATNLPALNAFRHQRNDRFQITLIGIKVQVCSTPYGIKGMIALTNVSKRQLR